jgi:hypothetical protein
MENDYFEYVVLYVVAVKTAKTEHLPVEEIKMHTNFGQGLLFVLK